MSGNWQRIGKPIADFRRDDVDKVPFPYTDRDTRQSRPASVIRTAKLATIEAADATKLGELSATTLNIIILKVGDIVGLENS